MKKNLTSLLGGGNRLSSSVFRSVMLTVLCLVLGTGAALAGPEDVKLTVTVKAVGGGKVAVSNRNTAVLNDGLGTTTSVSIYSYSRYKYTSSINWSNLSTRTSGNQREEDKVNYAYITAEADPGYVFLGWADEENADPRTNPASTAIKTVKHSTFSSHHRDWKFEVASVSGSGGDVTWNGIVKYLVTNSTTWGSHPDSKNLYAIFRKVNTVTFSAGDGATVSPSSKTVITGDPYGALPTPTRAGYTFDGWFTNQECTEGNKVGTSTTLLGEGDVTLYAKWTANTITIHFVDNERPQTGTQAATFADQTAPVNGAMPPLSAESYKKNWYQQVEGDKYFAGWYTRVNGEGERIYTGVVDGSGNLTIATGKETCTFTENVTLYAHYTHVKHKTYWDYTYLNFAESTMTWTDINSGDGSTRIEYGKLTFMKADGIQIKSVYFRGNINAAWSGDRGTINEDFSTHLTTYGSFHLQVADGSHAVTPDNGTVEGTLSGTTRDVGIWNVYFTEEELSQFAKYNFEPIAVNGSSEKVLASNWIRTTDLAGHNTVFSFNGAGGDNVADLSWTVNLTGLKVFPDYVIAKPLFWDGAKWAEISQLTHVDGVRCYKDAEHSTSEKAIYTGAYPVWKMGSTEAYGYALGMVGFEINGKTIYMNKTNPGTFDSNFNSATATNPNTENRTSKWPSTGEEAQKIFPEITYTIDASVIPVIRFLPGSAEGAQLDGGTPEIVWGSGAIANFSKTYFATRPEYTFVGWSEDEPITVGSQVWGDEEYTPTKAATFYPVWQDASAPVIVPQAVEYTTDRSVTIKVNVTDAQTTVTKVEWAVSETESEPATGWTDMTSLGEGNYSAVITDKSKVYIFIRATNSDGVSGTVHTPLVQVDHQAPVITPAKFAACNESIVVSFSDNVGVTQVKVNDAVTPLADGKITLSLTSGDSQTFNIWATDAAGNTAETAVTIFANHAWGSEQPVHDPTAEENGAIVSYYHCSHCGVYAFSTGSGVGEMMTEEQVTLNIIPAGSVLIKDNEGTTKAWGSDLNTAIEKIANDTGSNIKLTSDTNVTGGTINAPSTGTATLDLNGYGLEVNDVPAGETPITGNANVTILLKDNGTTPYTNGSKVNGSPINYHRTFAASTREGNWQAINLPINVASVNGYDLGIANSVNTTSGEAHLTVTKGQTAITAGKSYFIRSANGEINFTETTTLNPASTPAAETIPNSGGYTQQGCYSDLTCVSGNQFWVLTNGGQFAKAKVGAKQRPYHWVIYVPAGPSSVSFFSIIEEDADPTAITTVEAEAEDAADAPIYTISGVRVSSEAALAPGIYIRAGKKFIVR